MVAGKRTPQSAAPPVAFDPSAPTDRANVAAFYDVDGTLVAVNEVHAWAFYAANQPSVSGSLRKLASAVARLPLFWAVDKVSRKGFNELFYRQYRGESEDRLRFLADEMFETLLKRRIYPGARELIRTSRAQGIRQVVVTGGLDITVRRLADELGVDDVIANRLEFLDGFATGDMIPPIIAGAAKAQAVRDYCLANGVDMAKSFAYSDSYSDYPMLAMVGRPAAVHPDVRLRLAARDFGWPVLDLHGKGG